MLRVIEGLPADATVDQILGTLEHMLLESDGEPPAVAEADLPEGGLWDFLEK